MENPVEKALRIIAPGPSFVFEASVKMGIHPATLYKWLKAKRIKDGRRAIEVSLATGGQVSFQELVGYGGGVKSTATSCDTAALVTESQAAA